MSFTLIKEHPIITGGVVLGGGLLLYLYWKSGTNSTAPAGTSLVYNTGSGTNAYDASMQSTQLQANYANNKLVAEASIAQQQIQADKDVLMAQIAAQVSGYQQQTNQANIDAQARVSMAQLQANTSVTVNAQNTQTAITLTGLQIEGAKAIQAMNNATSITLENGRNTTSLQLADKSAEVIKYQTDAAVTINGQNTTSAVAINAANNQTAQQISANDLAAILNTNASAVTINEQNTNAAVSISNNEAATQQLAITTQGDLYSQLITSNEAITLAQMDYAMESQQSFQQFVTTNAGMALSYNRDMDTTGYAQVISALYGQGPQAIAANQPAAVASSPGSILNGIANIASAIF